MASATDSVRLGSPGTGTVLRVTVDDLALDTASMPPASAVAATRTIGYGYDGVDRLTSAVATGSPALSQSFSYDTAGNRQASGVTYNAANQRSDLTYDLAGNVTADGASTSTYDALNRLTSRTASSVTTSYGVNGDGALVSEQVGSGTVTRYTQDLATPLSQILSDGTTSYIYGADRLFRLSGSTRTWELHDGLGSVTRTSSDAGVGATPIFYEPFGTIQSGTPGLFGFTGERQSGSSVYLRARWYNASSGTFTARDPFAGFATTPYSLHSYQYGYANPVSNTDPTGEWIGSKNPAECIPPYERWDPGLQMCVLNTPLPDPNNPVTGGMSFIPVLGVGVGLPSPLTPDAEVLNPPSSFPRVVWPQNGTGRDGGRAGGTAIPWGKIVGIGLLALLLTCAQHAGDIADTVTSSRRDDRQHRVLAVGDGNFTYTASLAALRPQWNITGSRGPGSGAQTLISTTGNVTLLDNVDATALGVGITGTNLYDGIVFNNPHIRSKNTGADTAALIRGFINSARSRLKPGGEIHINLTNAVVDKYADVAAALAGATRSGRFGRSRYYAPYIPSYTDGDPFDWYKDDPARSGALRNFVFR